MKSASDVLILSEKRQSMARLKTDLAKSLGADSHHYFMMSFPQIRTNYPWKLPVRSVQQPKSNTFQCELVVLPASRVASARSVMRQPWCWLRGPVWKRTRAGNRSRSPPIWSKMMPLPLRDKAGGSGPEQSVCPALLPLGLCPALTSIFTPMSQGLTRHCRASTCACSSHTCTNTA